MAKKKKVEPAPIKPAEVVNTPITEILESNYMPYAMSVIVSRAIPEIDGLKPSHRKLLYSMYKMGLMTGPKVKSAKVVGQTMMLNPHGDAAIYETLVRLTTGRESLLHPLIESKGAFGKQYSDMVFSASRYTECKLAPICEELFDGIDRDGVDFVDNYDGTMKEPTLLPVSFPNILVAPNNGIAVGMTSRICSFNLAELCDATSLYLKNGHVSVPELLEIMPAPDFSTGGQLIYDKNKMAEIYSTGVGTFRVRSKWRVDGNHIEIYEIPYTTTAEKIKDSIVKLVKEGKVKEISDVRDEIGLNGLTLTIDIKRGVDVDKLMSKLCKSTPLEDTFGCNFNILIGGVPRTLGVADIIEEWSAFRVECLRRNYIFDLGKKSDKLHLLYGLRKILLDIDKAIAIIRHTENEKDVVPNLMTGFDIDKIQAEYVADIKLRNLNREYILNRTEEIGELEKEIENLKSLIASERKIRNVIIKQLTKIKEKYGKPRKTEVFVPEATAEVSNEPQHEDYPCFMFMSREGYFKKCLPASLRGSDVQKFKEGDELLTSCETTNCAEVLFFTNKAQVYKAHLYDFEDVKASALGDYIPAKLGFEDGEKVVAAHAMTDFSGTFVVFYENGKAVRFPAESYATVTNRKKLTKALAAGTVAVGVFRGGNEKQEYLIISSASRALLIKEKQITEKSTRSASGATVMTLKKGHTVVSASIYDPSKRTLAKESRYRKSALPSTGGLFEDDDPELNQMTLI